MKRVIFSIIVIICAFMTTSINAETISVSEGDSISTFIASAKDGDVIEIASGTYVGDITIDKNLVIRGAGKDNTIIDGKITITADATLENVTVVTDSSKNIGIWVNSSDIEVNVNNSNVNVKGYTEDNYLTYFGGIRIENVVSGTTLNVNNTVVNATYAVSNKGINNVVNITDSDLNGWAAFDITYSLGLAEGNEVNIIGSSLYGSSYQPTLYNGTSDNDWAVITIKSQKDLVMTIEDSVIENKHINDNRIDLIAITKPANDKQKPSENVTINVIGSELTNNDELSSVFYVESQVDADAPVFYVDSESTVTSVGDTYKINGDYVSLTFVDGDSVTIPVLKGTKITEDMLDVETVSGYEFKGWFTDSAFKNRFEVGTIVDENTILYANYEKIVENNVVENVKNPVTLDNVIVEMFMFILSIMAIIFTVNYGRRKYN